MKMIKPIVNLSKVAVNYDTFLLGFNGVVTDGNGLIPNVAATLNSLHKNGKKVILLTNSAQRVAAIAGFFLKNGVSMNVFSCIMSAGEILHYKLKVRSGDFAAVGNNYFHLGSAADDGVFSGLDFQPVDRVENAHFIYMNEVADVSDTLEAYLPALEHAAALGLPFVCAGNDTSSFKNGKICLAPGAVAEQYAVMGGRIITLGKPDSAVFNYCLDGSSGSVLVIGDNLATDIKGAELLSLDSMLVSKGVHVNFLGEGYIPDVAKTRELSNNFDVSPNYVISNLRW